MKDENPNEPWWLDTKAGKYLRQTEQEILDLHLPHMYGYHLLQCGPAALASLTSSSFISHRILINPEGTSHWPCSLLKAQCEQMPIQNDSVDVVVLTHSLEIAEHPHQVLREANRVLIPEGHVVITGINPFSCWGILTLIKNLFYKNVHTKMISPNRIRDWLHLLNIEVVQYGIFYYRPPLSNERIMSKLKFLEILGEKLWPFFGGAYCIVGLKKVVTLTPVKPRYEKRRPIWADAEGVAGSASYKQDYEKEN